MGGTGPNRKPVSPPVRPCVRVDLDGEDGELDCKTQSTPHASQHPLPLGGSDAALTQEDPAQRVIPIPEKMRRVRQRDLDGTFLARWDVRAHNRIRHHHRDKRDARRDAHAVGEAKLGRAEEVVEHEGEDDAADGRAGESDPHGERAAFEEVV